MIYLKRLWNAIIVTIAIVFGLICVPLMLIEVTIVAFVYYVSTGKVYTEEYESTAYYVSSWLLDTLTFKNN